MTSKFLLKYLIFKIYLFYFRSVSVEMQSQEKLRIMDSITLGNNDVETSRTNKSSTIPSPDVNSNMVYLNIYDLDNVSKVINSVAKPIGTGIFILNTSEFIYLLILAYYISLQFFHLKGAFHAGVEVYGYEYSFGYVSSNRNKKNKYTHMNSLKTTQMHAYLLFIIRW